MGFYNLENLFDTIDSPGVNDIEYTPNGLNKWNTYKYNSKLEQISYAISRIGLEHSPLGVAILGVAEVENRKVLEDLTSQPDIASRPYEIVHYDSSDPRGIDVALLYNPDLFTVSNSVTYPLYIKDEPDFRTRDQLLVSGYLLHEKTHIIVNHWPARYGNELASRAKRIAAAGVTKSIVDSICKIESHANIIIMGDMNDDPSDESTAVFLGAKKNPRHVKKGALYNPMWALQDKGKGSSVYKGQWNLFDQIIVSYDLLHTPRTGLKFWKAEVFNAPFLTHQEGENIGTPIRTHSQGTWLNGYSDHYPTLIYLTKEVK
ncbi:endonuclease/exonuclease/phosphatase family protein [Paludibacter sp. 221]|nr:endonuclease/exonuclease/phosphatase family protein [Paludibacter sp. 221]